MLWNGADSLPGHPGGGTPVRRPFVLILFEPWLYRWA